MNPLGRGLNEMEIVFDGGMVTRGGHFSSKENSHFGLTFAEQLCFISWTAEAVEIFM